MKSQAVLSTDQQKTWSLDRDAGSASAAARSASPHVLFSAVSVNIYPDALMLGALTAAGLTARVNPGLHIPLGLLLLLLIGIHVFLHWRFWVSVPKGLREGGLRFQWKWLLKVALLAAFIPAVFSGLMAALIFAPRISGFHGSSAAAFSILAVIHLGTSRKWIAN